MKINDRTVLKNNTSPEQQCWSSDIIMKPLGLSYNFGLAKAIFRREFAAMYKRTTLGPLWALVAPAMYMLVFIFFRLLFGLSNPEGIPMLPFLFSGLALWLLFSTTLSSIFPALISNVGIMKKMPINPMVFVLSGSLMPLLTCCMHVVLLEALLVYYGYIPSAQHLLIPFIVVLVQAFAVGIALIVCSIGFYRQDIIQLLPTVIQLGMFATPVFFSPSIIPEKLKWAFSYNPIAICVQWLRDIIFFTTVPQADSVIRVLLCLAVLWVVGLLFFRRTSRYIADIY